MGMLRHCGEDQVGFSKETVHMDTRSVRWEDIIFCGGRDHRLTYDILNIK